MYNSNSNNQTFKTVIKSIKASIYRGFSTHLLYVRGRGFLVQRNISINNQKLLDSNKAYIVGFYGKGIEGQWIIDDCEEFLETGIL